MKIAKATLALAEAIREHGGIPLSLDPADGAVLLAPPTTTENEARVAQYMGTLSHIVVDGCLLGCRTGGRIYRGWERIKEELGLRAKAETVEVGGLRDPRHISEIKAGPSGLRLEDLTKGQVERIREATGGGYFRPWPHPLSFDARVQRLEQAGELEVTLKGRAGVLEERVKRLEALLAQLTAHPGAVEALGGKIGMLRPDPEEAPPHAKPSERAMEETGEIRCETSLELGIPEADVERRTGNRISDDAQLAYGWIFPPAVARLSCEWIGL